MRIMRASGGRDWGSCAGVAIGHLLSKDRVEMQTEIRSPPEREDIYLAAYDALPVVLLESGVIARGYLR